MEILPGKHHGSIIVDNNNQRLTFTPQKAFAFGEKVQAILTAGIYFSDGTQLAHGYSWKYHIKNSTGERSVCWQYQNLFRVVAGRMQFQPATSMVMDFQISLLQILSEIVSVFT